MTQVLRLHTADVTSVMISAEGDTIVSASKDRRIVVWELDDGENEEDEPIYTASSVLEGHSAAVNCVWLSLTKKYIISCSDDLTIVKWRFYYEEGKFIKEEVLSSPDGHTAPVTCVCLSLDDTVIVSGSMDHSVIVWVSAKNGGDYSIQK